MPVSDLLKRLEALNGGPLSNIPEERPEQPASASVAAQSPQPRAPRRPAKPSVTRFLKSLPPAPLEECLPGEARACTAGGIYYHIERPLRDHAEGCDGICESLPAALAGSLSGTRRRRAGKVALSEVLFLDLETLGLSAEPLFLIGLLRVLPSGDLSCCQLLARDLSEEAAALGALHDLMTNARLLVSFNGIGFDVPYVRRRASVHGITVAEPKAHIDVLLEARKRHKGTVPNCKLQTLEEHICGRIREDDVPGSHIPAVYQQFLSTGNAAPMAHVVKHNLLDLATTADLFVRYFA